LIAARLIVKDSATGIVVWGVGTPRTLRVYWALHELGLDYEIEPIQTRTESMESRDFRRVSPGKKIPGFQHRELRLTESGAITRYLMDSFGAEQWSAAERAEIDRWTFFVLTELDATALYVIRRHEGLPEIYGEAPAAVSAAYEYAARQFDVLENTIADGRSYLLGERFSEADIHLGTCLDWARFIPIDLPEHISVYHERLRGRPAYQAARAANGPPPQT
jgi:glutathione S-transferase